MSKRRYSMVKQAPQLFYAMRKGYRIGQGLRKAFHYRTLTKQKRKQPTSGQGITEQYDKKTIYRKRSMPRFKRRRWRKFKSKVLAVSERSLGSRTFVFNTQDTPSQNISGTQLVYDVSLYGFKSTVGRHNDMVNIVQKENTGDQTALAGETIDDTTKFLFQSGVLDITIRNSSFNNEGPGNNVPIAIEMDIYEVYVSKDTDNTANDLNTFVDLMLKASNDSKQIGGGTASANSLSIFKRGATPWDTPTALSRYRIKIAKKTKYFLSAGQTMTYQFRDPRRRTIERQRVNERSGYSRPGWTKTMLIIAKSVPGFNVGFNEGEATIQLNLGMTRKYLYKIEGMNDTREYYQAT